VQKHILKIGFVTIEPAEKVPCQCRVADSAYICLSISKEIGLNREKCAHLYQTK